MMTTTLLGDPTRLEDSASAPAVLTALVAVLHRRSVQEAVHVDLVDAEGRGRGSVSVELTDVRTFADVLADVSAQLGRAAPTDARPPTAGADAVFCPDTRAFDPRCADDNDHITAQVRTAVREGRRTPDRPLAVLSLASEADLTLIDEWSGTGRAPVTAACVHEQVADQARRTPAAVAVSCAGSTLTYAELDARADRLAGRLVAAGVVADEIVGVYAERSPDLVVALLAVLKAGGAYAALDPDLPAARLEHLLVDTCARVVVASQRLAARLPTGPIVVDLDDRAAADVPATARPARAGGPDTLAYISYTSGSTGEPKGACVPHAAVSRLIREPDWARFGSDDVFLMLAPVAFDASTLEIWAPLVTGARLAVFPAGPVDVDALGATLRQEGVTVLWLTAGLFHQMAATHLEAFAQVRHLLAGGDVVSPLHVARLLTAHPGLTFTNGYGPTENTTFTACWTSTTPPGRRAVPIGRPISGTRVHVLDPDLQPTPVGVPGELYAGGAGLARGYLNRPGPTARSFVPDPFSPPGGRMYRTGDLARWLPDGNLEFLGRADRQIKVQGFRVEPGEIEAAIVGRPEVDEAVVVAQSDGAEGKRLVAYVTPANAEDLHPRELARQVRDRLRDELPAYMVPWAVVTLDTLPLNRNGKVDRAALPPATRIARALPGPYVGPRSRLEADVAALWSDVLGIEPVGVDDDFFEMGGHSLIAAEILAGLHRGHGVEITARTLYLRPTVAELAETLGELLPASAENQAQKGERP